MSDVQRLDARTGDSNKLVATSPTTSSRTFPGPRRRILAGSTLAFLPLTFFFTYLSITVLIFAFGPWPWPVRNGIKLYAFLALSHAALIAGYAGAIGQRARSSTVRWSPKTLLWLSLSATLLLLAPTLSYRTSGHVNLVEAITNPGQAYSRAGSAPTDSYDVRYVEYARIMLGPVLYLLLPFTVVYWSRLGWAIRICATAAIAGDLSIWIATGRNKGIADFLLVLPWLLLIEKRVRSGTIPRKTLVQLIGILVLGSCLFAAVFSWFVSSRQGLGFIETYDEGAQIEARPILPGSLSRYNTELLIGLASYISQGYYGLSLGLEEPFVPTWGLGNSLFAMALAEKVSGNNTLHENTYPSRIEKYGWRASQRFHTFYLWIASDVSFAGTIVVMWLLGRLLRQSWAGVLEGSSPLAVAVFFNLLILFYYIPANNQIMQFGEHTSSFWVCLAVWWATTRRRRAARAVS
jgi:hypothetical protein